MREATNDVVASSIVRSSANAYFSSSPSKK